MLDKLKAPKGMIRVEEHLTYYQVESKCKADNIINLYEEPIENRSLNISINYLKVSNQI